MEFFTLDFERESKVPIILGRPFLATGVVLIYVATSKLTIRPHDKVEMFDVYREMKLLAIYVEFSAITIIDNKIC